MCTYFFVKGQMDIRLGSMADVNACLAIDDSFATEYVWQMDEQILEGSIKVSFRLAHLPRPMKVRGVASQDDLAHGLAADAALIVAEDVAIRGFVEIALSEWNQIARINSMVVAPAFRRQGIGGALLEAAIEWARLRRVRQVVLNTSTKDFPAICFFQKHGFTFSGFTDKIYPNQDIALFFSITFH